MSKDKGGIVEEVFTPSGKQYIVKSRVVLYNLRQALALRSIISSFETSALMSERKGVRCQDKKGPHGLKVPTV